MFLSRTVVVKRVRQAVDMLRSGMMTTDDARHLRCDRSTTVRLNQQFQATGTTNDHPRPGQSHVTT